MPRSLLNKEVIICEDTAGLHMIEDSSLTVTALGTSNIINQKYFKKITSGSNTHNSDKVHVGNLG